MMIVASTSFAAAADRQDGTRASGATGYTECERQRSESEINGIMGMTGQRTPSCDPDGSFSSLQCHSSIGFCWCALADGKEVEGTRFSVRNPGYTKPDCSIHRVSGERENIKRFLSKRHTASSFVNSLTSKASESEGGKKRVRNRRFSSPRTRSSFLEECCLEESKLLSGVNRLETDGIGGDPEEQTETANEHGGQWVADTLCDAYFMKKEEKCNCKENAEHCNQELFCHHIDHCAANPCQNGGKCVDLEDDYTCECQPGWVGKKCEEDQDDCATNPCLNDGNCVDKLDGYICKCQEGWEGANCGSKRLEPTPGLPLRLINIHGEETDGKENWGLVQVFFDGQWGTVCDDYIEREKEQQKVGDVICRQLGTPNGGRVERFWWEWGEKWLKSAELDLKNTPIWLNHIECDGEEARLEECDNDGIGVSAANCDKHREDIYLLCNGDSKSNSESESD